MNAPDNNLERRARTLYREASRSIDPVNAGRLRAARREALAAASAAPSHTRLTRVLVPAGAFAAVAFAALMMWSPMQPNAQAPSSISEVGQVMESDDLPPDPTNADPKLVQNLDFYGWLATTDDGSQASR